MPTTREAFEAARAILRWAVFTRRMSYFEHRDLMRNLNMNEARVFGCTKRGFGSFGEAQSIADHRRGKDGHKRRSPYRCEACGKFHLADSRDLRERRIMKVRARA